MAMKRRKWISVLLSAALILGAIMSAAAHADAGPRILSSKIIECINTGFIIAEEVDENYRIIRTLERGGGSQTQRFSNVYAEAEAILSVLGMRRYNISRLTSDQMAFIVASPRIQSTVSYTKVDYAGHVLYVEPAVAYLEAELARQTEMAEMEQRIQQDLSLYEPIQPMGGGVGVANDGIMSLIHIVGADIANPARHLFISDALWLQMPSSRRTDTIGSVATSIAIDFNTIRGWYSYAARTVTSTILGGTTINDNFFSRNASTQHRINGNWQGAASILNMPPDSAISEQGWFMSHTNSNFNAVTIFEALMVHPHVATNFNSIGSYYHNGFGFSFGSPSVSISIGGGGVSASIGWSPTLQFTTKRNVPLLISFIP